MYAFLHDLLSDKKGGEIFRCFSPWHFGYILIAVAMILVAFFTVRKKSASARMKTAGAFSDIAFGLYMADFFLMPFAYEMIDIEKLPFHVCTAMCVMCFLSRYVKALEPYRIHFTLLGFISNLVYLIYPAGVMWHAVHPLCYRVVQTLLFHGVMTAYGFLTLAFDEKGLSFKTCCRDLIVLAAMTLWAILGNILYRGAAGSYDHDFNWFFVEADPFGMMDTRVAPLVMPFVNIAVFFAVEMVVYLIYYLCKKKFQPADLSGKGKKIMKECRFKEFRYSPGYSDMRGARHHEELKKDENGAWIIVCYDREDFQEPEKVTTYAVSEENALQFAAFLEERNFISLSKRKDSDLFVTDYSPWDYNIIYERTDENLRRFERNVYYTISEYKKYSDKDYKLLKEVNERFKALRGEKISERVEEER